MLQDILSEYGLSANEYHIQEFGTGLINHTWKVTGVKVAFILQRINTTVFKTPENIDHNLIVIKQFLAKVAPDYLFAGPIPTADNRTTVYYKGHHYRLQPFIQDSHTVDAVVKNGQAYQAAKQFGKFSRLLSTLDPSLLKLTLPDFHNLKLRVEQFDQSLEHATDERITTAKLEIESVMHHLAIAEEFEKLVEINAIPQRVIHHDTKISNVLFDSQNKGICVIDLDTVMPGYFISDVGDMMRTYLCEATEEEHRLEKIAIRLSVFEEIYKGYCEEMGAVLTELEKELFIYSGKFMIYMQATRFLTDFLNNDIYYPVKYPGHNLVRARNQITLLNRYLELEAEFKKITG